MNYPNQGHFTVSPRNNSNSFGSDAGDFPSGPMQPPQQPFGNGGNGGDYGPLEIQCSSQQQQPNQHQPPQYYSTPQSQQQMDVDMDPQHQQLRQQHSSSFSNTLQPIPPRRTVSFGGLPPPQMQQQQHPFMHPPPPSQPQHCSPQLQHHPHQQQPPTLQQQSLQPPPSFNMDTGSTNNNSNNNGYLHPLQPPPQPSSEQQQHSPFNNFNNNNSHYSMPPPLPQQPQQQHHHQQQHPPPMRKFSHIVMPQHSGFLDNYPPPQQPNHEIFRAHSTVTVNLDNHQNQNQPPLSWRKMSLAPNFKMNSSYSGGDSLEDQKPLQRTPSQVLEYHKRKLSLRRFSSQLRSTRVPGNASNPSMLSLTPYTPPPILSPIRNGSGLFCKIARKPSEFRKRSALFDMATDVIMEEEVPSGSGQDSGIADDMDQGPSPATPEDALSDEKQSLTPAPAPFIRPPIDNRANRPQRKVGLFLSGQETTSTGFVAELEALRKESAESSMSGKSLEALQTRYIQQPRKCSIRASTSGGDDVVIRKMSTVSMDEPIINRKISTLSEAYYDYQPCESDITPHINLGKHYQARVRKWADREIMPHEREAIPDRDECLFDCNVTEHLDEQTVAAYEALACSASVPKVGHNKELALHILMENKGNIQAAVMDLLRSDTLDWEQYPIIYNYRYSNVENWTPDDIQSFQDAIYKSEKDFHQVSAELSNRTVKDCIEFYYMWKKMCPDDYRKLRNLRRKRHLLEQQLDYPTSVSKATPFQDHPMEESSEDEIESESDTDVGTPMYASDRSPDESRPVKMPRLAETPSPSERKNSVRFVEPEKLEAPIPSIAVAAANGLSLYPWLHGENGVFPSPSPSSVGNSAGTGQSYSQPPSVGNNDIFASPATNERMPTGFNPDILHAKIANIHRVTASKKGAQPSADGFFHCRLCDKRFEKVKSLNAHMKSHAMKARAEAEAQSQGNTSTGGGNSQPSHPHSHSNSHRNNPNHDRSSHSNSNNPGGNNGGLLGNHSSHLDALNQQLNNAVSANAGNVNGNNSLSNTMGGSPLNFGHHLSRMTQFASPMGLGAANPSGLPNLPPGMNMNMFSPDMISAMHQLANLPQHNGGGNLSTTSVASSVSALQQLHNNLQQHSATIIN